MAPSAVTSQKFQVLQSASIWHFHTTFCTPVLERQRPLFESNFPNVQLNSCSPRLEQQHPFKPAYQNQETMFMNSLSIIFIISSGVELDLTADRETDFVSGEARPLCMIQLYQRVTEIFQSYGNSPRGRTESSPQPCQAAQGDASASPAAVLRGNLQATGPS